MSVFVTLASSGSDKEAAFGTIYATLFGGAAIIGLNTYLVSEIS